MSFTDLPTQLSAVVGDAFTAMGLDAALGAVRRSDRPDLGDYQCNGALAAAKQQGKNPREIADAVVEKLKGNALFKDVTVAGPGFVNLILTDAAVAAHAAAIAADTKTGLTPAAPQLKVLVDFAGPNVAKPMHVGHLRATIIGDAVQRIARFVGHNVVTDAHFGDWGLQVGLLITLLQDEKPELPYFRDDYNDSMKLDKPPVTMDDLDRMYPAASARMKEDEAYRDRARKATAELQKGKPGYLALHKHFWEVSQCALEREFGALGVTFDLWKSESDVNYLIDGIVEDLTKRGVAVPDDGAIAIHVARNTDKAEMPPLLLVSSEGSAMYGTTDVATVVERERDIKADLYLYCVDQRQALHFTQVFRACDKAGYANENKFEHIGFGTMNGTDGKPFKTRAGGVMKLHDLITMVREKAMERLNSANLAADITGDAREKVALQVGVAALRFADLSSYRMTNYVFDLDRFSAFEGKTGPYLQYQGVRIKSLLRKASDAGNAPGAIAIELPEEKALALQLDAFNAAVHLAFEKRAPNFVADHVYNLAGAFSTLYGAAPLAAEADPVKRASRLALAALTLKQLETGLSLLGIEIPERM